MAQLSLHQMNNTIKILCSLVLFFSITVHGQNSWNLKLATQPDFTTAIAQSYIQPFYDERDMDSNLKDVEEKPVERDINNPRFFQTPAGIFAVVIVQNIAREDPAVSGWCDIFLFAKKNSQWYIAGRHLGAGGGMYGHSGEFKKFDRIGKNMVGVVIKSGIYHMGQSFDVDEVIGIEGEKITKIVSISTSINNSQAVATDRAICAKNTYKFIPSQKKNYDLQIVMTSCAGTKKERETGRVIVPCLNKKYKIPDDFKFEM